MIIDSALSYSVAGWLKVTGGEGRRFLWEKSPSNWAISPEVTAGGNVKVFAKLADSCEDPRLVPEYYRYLFFEMNVWFEIGELIPMHSNELAKYTEDIVYAVKRRKSISKTLASAGY